MLCDAHRHANSIVEATTGDAFKISIHCVPSLTNGLMGVFVVEYSQLLDATEKYLQWFFFAGKQVITL